MVPEGGRALLNTVVKNQQNFALRNSGLEFSIKGRRALCSQHCPVALQVADLAIALFAEDGGKEALIWQCLMKRGELNVVFFSLLSSFRDHRQCVLTRVPFLAGVNNTCGIDAMNPSSKDDFTEFGKLLKEKITQYEKSLHYASFLEALVRDVCISCK